MSDWIKIGVPVLLFLGGSWLAFESRTSGLEAKFEMTEARLDRLEADTRQNARMLGDIHTSTSIIQTKLEILLPGDRRDK